METTVRPIRTLALGIVFLSFLKFAVAQDPVPAVSEPVSVKIDSITLQSVQPDRIELLARMGMFPERSLKIKAFSFSAMKVNDIPVYVGPIDGEFAIKKGEYFKLPDVKITIYVRDLTSVEPARKMVQEQKVRISGEVTARIDANPFEQFALHSLHPSVVLPLNKEIPVDMPGGEVGRRAALSILELASQMGPSAAKLLGTIYPGEDSAWRRDVGKEEVKHVVLIRTNYTVVDDKGSYPFEFEQLGFWVGPSTVLVPDEAIEPWEFDADSQTRLHANHGHIDKASIAIAVRPASATDTQSGDPTQWTLKQGDFTIETETKPGRDHVAASGKVGTGEVLQRGSTNNYAVLRFRDGIVGSPVKIAAAGGNGWDRLAILRLVRGKPGDEARTEVVMLPGTIEGKQIRLGQPIDDSGFGSPVFTEDGVVGMVLDENNAVLLSSIKRLDERAK
jgi:hypothetical protein